MYKKKLIFAGILLLLVVLIRIFSANSFIVERYYSIGIYAYIGGFFRWLTGWLPFSLGDILYGLAAIWLIWKTSKGVKVLFKKQVTTKLVLQKSTSFVIALLIIYIVFNVLWGINYNRLGIEEQLGLKIEKYSPEDVKTISNILLQKVNENKGAIVKYGPITLSNKEIFYRSKEAYDLAS